MPGIATRPVNLCHCDDKPESYRKVYKKEGSSWKSEPHKQYNHAVGMCAGFYMTLGIRKEERKEGEVVPFLGHLCPQKWDLAKSCHFNCRVLPTLLNHVWRFL